MNLVMSLYVVLLFVLLTPGVLLTLPKGGSKLTVAAVHGVVFAVVYYLTHRFVWRLSVSMDGFEDSEGSKRMGMGMGMGSKKKEDERKEGSRMGSRK